MEEAERLWGPLGTYKALHKQATHTPAQNREQPCFYPRGRTPLLFPKAVSESSAEIQNNASQGIIRFLAHPALLLAAFTTSRMRFHFVLDKKSSDPY